MSNSPESMRLAALRAARAGGGRSPPSADFSPPPKCASGALPTPQGLPLSKGVPLTSEALLAMLDALGIESETVSHPPLFTVEESKALRGELRGAHIKNLFLRVRPGKADEALWLLTCAEDRALDLKSVAPALGSPRVSFAKAEQLRDVLGVEPGAVTPFAVVNDTEKRVRIVLDVGLASVREVNAHPLVNTATTRLAVSDLVRFLEHCGHPPQWLGDDNQLYDEPPVAPPVG